MGKAYGDMIMVTASDYLCDFFCNNTKPVQNYQQVRNSEMSCQINGSAIYEPVDQSWQCKYCVLGVNVWVRVCVCVCTWYITGPNHGLSRSNTLVAFDLCS